ncbi:hypothetical protein ASPVEDRAFT_44776 [Aspergillus versicolor CBS 583.65]|uniref:Uncharacterized protein n=1 Tax=Aspergillus versicolor CBS 583.65 TaxID=1036611 RepID=A0A1L9PUN3_ASPVE|nr:uncharacterized protein ASPVEDRAFT_44776 [Aspergillus versicolor CBS 583.65]OJJ05259.1 hypothetical protein ASPVEDRAFT_44776 [Aspergillus versicolor CBS 583.65]
MVDIWPWEESSTPGSPAEMVGSTVLENPPRGMSWYHAKDYSKSRASSFTMSDDLPQNIPEDIDAVIDDLLVLTQEPAGPPPDRSAVSNLQLLARFPEQLWQRLEEEPDRLGPSRVSSHVLAVAYAGRSHLNWVAFQNLTLSVIAAAVASDELRGASALSVCVDQFEMEREEGLEEFTATVAQCTGLRQLCLLQRPDRDSDDASAHFCSQLLLLSQQGPSEERGGLGWLHGKTIYATCAFSTSLRSHKFLTSSSTITRSSTSPHGQILPVMHIFMFSHYQSEDGPGLAADNIQPYRNYYTMNNTLLEAESFAVQFLAYLQSLGSGSDSEKAILQFTFNRATSSSSGQLGVIPIPAGFFDYELPPNDPSRAKLNDIHSGSWVILVGSSDQSSDHNETLGGTPSGPCRPPPPYYPTECHADTSQTSANMDRGSRMSRSSDDTVVAENAVFVHYSFVKVRQPFTEIDDRHQQMPISTPNRAEVVGGLTDFLRQAAPGSDIPAWEKRIGEMVMSLRTRRAPIGIDIGVMTEIRARALLNQLL